MKKLLIFALVILIVNYFANNGSLGQDISALQPVQTIRITRDDGGVRIETDTGETGGGKDVCAAIADLRTHSLSEIFLDTADYLLIDPSLTEELPQMLDALRPACMVVLEQGKATLEEVGRYLKTHRPMQTLIEYCAGKTDLPSLQITEEGMVLVP